MRSDHDDDFDGWMMWIAAGLLIVLLTCALKTCDSKLRFDSKPNQTHH